MRGLIGPVFSGAKLGIFAVVFGSTAIFAQAMMGTAVQIYVVNWMWTMWLGAGLLTGLRSGYHAQQQGWFVGAIAGALLGGVIGTVQYLCTGWVAYSWQIFMLFLLSGCFGGAAGINVRLNRNYRLARRRMYYRG